MADSAKEHPASVAFRIALAVINAAISVVVPLFIMIFGGPHPPLSKGEAYLLGVLLLVGQYVFETWIIADRASAIEIRLTRIWDARSKLDARLQDVRRLFHELEESKRTETDLFASYFDHRLLDLETDLRDACSKKQIQVDDTMLEVTTWLLQSSFQGRPKDIFRAIHLTADNNFFFDVHAQRYFRQMLDLMSRRKALEVRRLIIYVDEDELQDPRLKRLIAFHQHQDHYEAKLLPRATFDKFLKDYHLHHLVQDFGVYGDTYLYKGVLAQKDDIVGEYSRDEAELERFTDCFNTCWESAEPPAHDEAVDEAGIQHDMSLSWLYRG